MLKQTVTVLWQYLVKSSLFLFSLLIVLFHNTVVKFHISCIFKSIWQRIFPSTFSANSNNQEVVDESYKLSRDEMALFAMQYGGVVARVVSNPLFKTFYTTRGELKGLVPYRQSWNTVVVVGDPICNTTSSECFEFVCEQFYKYCSQFNYQVIYAAVSEEFVQHINKMNTNSSMLQFGETLLFNTNDSTKKRLKGRKQRGLASKINQAKKQGITVQEFYLPVADSQEVVSTASSTTTSPVPNDYNSALKDKILQVAESWSNNRTGVQAYLTPIDIFGDPIGKRWFYATQNDQVVAVAVIMLVERLRYYMIKNVLVTPSAPKGISELMVMHMFETIENEPYNKAKVLTFGPGPSPMFLKEQKGFDFSTSILFKLLRMCMENGYLSSVSNTFSFRKKFVPDTAEPAFVVFYRQQSMSLYNALSILHTFHIVSSFLNSSEE